jgi:peptidoglycan/LPS O-acetylase OafA/YrhL
MRFALRIAVALFAVAILSGAAAACPVCFSATDQNRMAFFGTTVLLSLLPLGMVAGGVLYLRRRARQLGEETHDLKN